MKNFDMSLLGLGRGCAGGGVGVLRNGNQLRLHRRAVAEPSRSFGDHMLSRLQSARVMIHKFSKRSPTSILRNQTLLSEPTTAT